MKILVVTSLIRYPGQTTPLYGRALQSIFRLNWNGRLDHLMLNGNDDPLKPVESCGRKNREAQEIALREGYDAVLFADHDMIVPPDGLERLSACNAPIAYGLYVLRHLRDGYQWSAALEVEPYRWKSYSSAPDLATNYWNAVHPVAGMGFGFTLVRREALEAITLRWYDHACTDWALSVDAQRAGILQVCDFGLHCGHMSMTPSPRVLWPDVTQDSLVRVEYLSE